MPDGLPPAPFLTKDDANEALMMECMRHCVLWGFDFARSKEYFATRGLTLGRERFKRLVDRVRGESRDWYTEGALTNWEHDHKTGILRLTAVEERLATAIHDAEDPKVLAQLSGRLVEIRAGKDAMMESTPLVQELMRVHRQKSLAEAPPLA